jgi:Zn-dependent alcohol dehydrogenase
MRTAVLREIGAPLTLEDVELDEPKAGEVLVRIEAAGVCHSDLHYMTGDLPAKLPLVVGHEGAGIVEGVGLAAVMGAALAGAHPVIAIDIDPAKLELARQVGATHVVNAGTEDVVARVLEITGTGVPWLIEAVGRPQTMRQAIDCLRPGGTLVAIGLSRVDATVAVPINDLVQRQKRVVGSLYGSSNPRVVLPRIFALYLAGRLPLDALIGLRRPLAEVNEAYADLRAGGVGRMILLP